MLLRKTKKFHWGVEQQKAFETLRDKLCSDPILQQPDFSKRFWITTDASNIAISYFCTKAQSSEDSKTLVINNYKAAINVEETTLNERPEDSRATGAEDSTHGEFLVKEENSMIDENFNCPEDSTVVEFLRVSLGEKKPVCRPKKAKNRQNRT